MMIFTIDSENNIAAHASASEITDKGSEQFTSEKELAQLAADWPGSGRGLFNIAHQTTSQAKGKGF